MTLTGWIVVIISARIADMVIWYFLNRYSVRANEQIELLKEISEKQSLQIETIISNINKKEAPEKNYLQEARKKAGLI